MTRRLLPLTPLLLCLLAGPLAAGPQRAPADPPRQAQPEQRQAGAGQERPALSLFDPDLHMRTADVRIGMTGYGLSVFKGTEIERFEVEVLAIRRNTEQIATDLVLIRASGANLEHTGPIAGMSGSPVYLRCDDGKDRLLGAFAFGWPGSKEPIAGVQPIEAMLRLDPRPRPAPQERQDPGAALPQGLRYDPVAAGALPKLRTTSASSLAELLGEPRRPRAQADGLMPLAIPLTVSGFKPEAIELLMEVLGAHGFAARLQAGGGVAQVDFDRLEAGSTLVVPILLGDLNLVATGTCTTVIGEHVFGFGHPMIGEGPSTLPLAAGAVDAVIPTTEISFKLGSPGQVVGTLATDAVPGVAGIIGPVPEMVPVKLQIRRGQETQDYQFRLARHPMLTPAALAAAAMSAADLGGTADPRGATRWDMRLQFDGGRQLHLRDITGNRRTFGPGGFVAALVMPLSAIENNPFGEARLESVEAAIELLPAHAVRLATLTEMSLPRTRYKAGETVRCDLMFELDRGRKVIHRVELELPEDLSPGEYPLNVSESAGAIMGAAMQRPFEFEVKSLDDLFAAINNVQEFSSDAVYLRLDRPEETALAVGRQALPRLPESRALLLAESGRSDVHTFSAAVFKRVELPYVLIEGEADAVITILPE